jgi:hypothetical protein
MPKKRVLFITNFIGMSPFIASLTRQLINEGIEVDVIDTGAWHFYRNNEVSKTAPFYASLFKMPILGHFLMLLHLSILIRKHKNYDAVDVLYLQPQLRRFGKYLSKHNNRLMVSYAGSDFYRVSERIKIKTEVILEKCDAITFGNYQMADDFNEYYRDKYKAKIYSADFGMDILPILDKNKNASSKARFRNNNGINEDDIIITIGYNGHDEQQHIKIIESIKTFRTDKIFLLVPFTYGGTQEYLNKVLALLAESKFRFKIFTKYLPDEDIADIRINTDIAINIQFSDQGSSSLLEHIYSGSIVLAAEWLPYKFWDDMGVYYHRVNENNLVDKLGMIIMNIKEEQVKCRNNNTFIGNIFTWKHQVKLWLNAFQFENEG